jgi:hypothetical protein
VALSADDEWEPSRFRGRIRVQVSRPKASQKTKRPPSRRPTTPSALAPSSDAEPWARCLALAQRPRHLPEAPPERRAAPAAPACGALHHGRPPLLAGWQPDEGAQD